MGNGGSMFYSKCDITKCNGNVLIGSRLEKKMNVKDVLGTMGEIWIWTEQKGHLRIKIDYFSSVIITLQLCRKLSLFLKMNAKVFRDKVTYLLKIPQQKYKYIDIGI